jgi:NAD(P)-dependent dehydrogenase (short-subunit alcohol dehydrogenase family)
MAQTVFITGTSSGFGRLMVDTLAHQGYTVVAGTRETEGRNAQAAADLRALAEREHLDTHIVEIDVNDNASVERAIESSISLLGRLDVVINNAGTTYLGPLEAFTIEQAQRQFDVNVFSVMRVNRAALPHMRRQGSGLLIQIGSIVGRVALPFLGLYGATKFALEGLTESYRQELAPFGIDVAILEPGTFPTPLSTKRQTPVDQERATVYQSALAAFTTPFFAENHSATPPNPQDVADAVARVIAQPAGTRPLHTAVATPAQREDPQAINAAVAGATEAFFTRLALPHMEIAPRSGPIPWS